MCSESRRVLVRLPIVQLDHTYANSPSWSQSIERIAVSIHHDERLHTGPYNHSAELRASGKERKRFSCSSYHHLETREERKISDVLQRRCFWVFFKDLFLPNTPPLHSDRVQLFGKYLIVWPCVFETWRTSVRSCFFRSSPGLLLFFFVFFFSLLVQSWWTLQRTGCDRRRRFVWNLPQFREKGVCVLCVCVKRSRRRPPASRFPPAGYTTDSGLSSVLNNEPPSEIEQESGDNPEMTQVCDLDLRENKWKHWPKILKPCKQSFKNISASRPRLT